jgi:hypothetical protein
MLKMDIQEFSRLRDVNLKTVHNDNANINLVESLKKAGFSEDQIKYFLEGRGGSDDLTESYLAAKKKNLMEGGK